MHKVILGKALDVLKTIPDASIDHIITDPPYNISSKAKQTMKGPNIVTAEFGSWDCETKEEYDRLFVELLKEYYRVCKNGANALIWLDKAYSGVAWFQAESLGWHPSNIIAAVKKNPSPRKRKKNVKSAWESCLWLSKGPVKTCNWNVCPNLNSNVMFYNIGAEKVSDHPNEKYESMIEPLVERYTNEGDTVLDTYCGSGTVAFVCKKKNRKSISIDYDKKWADFTLRRLDSITDPIY